MKTILLSVLFLASTTYSAIAQKGKNQIGIGAEIAFPTGTFGEAFKTGFGGWAKFLFGVGKYDQVSFSSGFTSFTAKGSGTQASASIGILPILIGLRHTITQGLYVEPQLGYGSYHAKVSASGQSASDSKGAFTYALGLGYVIDNIDFGVRYQNGKIEGDNYSNVAIRVGYNFDLHNKSSK